MTMIRPNLVDFAVVDKTFLHVQMLFWKNGTNRINRYQF